VLFDSCADSMPIWGRGSSRVCSVPYHTVKSKWWESCQSNTLVLYCLMAIRVEWLNSWNLCCHSSFSYFPFLCIITVSLLAKKETPWQQHHTLTKQKRGQWPELWLRFCQYTWSESIRKLEEYTTIQYNDESRFIVHHDEFCFDWCIIV
jgi:hypothetical protein